MLNKKNIVLMALATTAAGLLILTQTAASHQDQCSNKLEGAWTITMPGTPILGSFVFGPTDPSGRSAAMSGKLAVHLPAAQAFFPDLESVGEFAGEAVMTGPHTLSFTVIGYGTKKVVPTPTSPFEDQLVLIWVDSGQGKFKAPGKMEVVHHIAYYLPAADTNGDGIPEGAPLYCIEGAGVNTRVALMPPCQP